MEYGKVKGGKVKIEWNKDLLRCKLITHNGNNCINADGDKWY
jgi:hypothetical protein